MRVVCIFGIITALLLAAPVFAETPADEGVLSSTLSPEDTPAVEDAENAAPAGDNPVDSRVVRTYKKEAERGSVEAQFVLGSMYMQGNGVPKDEAEGAKWFLKAAEQDDERAQTNLGRMYLDGQGVEKNSEQGLEWLRKAGNQNSVEAQLALGMVLMEGVLAEKNEAEAAEWFLKAAQQNDAKAQNNLGILYAKGLGVEQNMAQAYAWWTLAAGSESSAAKNLELMQNNMSADDIAKGKELVRQFKMGQGGLR